MITIIDLYKRLLATEWEIHTTLHVNPQMEITKMGKEVNDLIKYLGPVISELNLLADDTIFRVTIVGKKQEKYAVEFNARTYWDIMDGKDLSEFFINAINKDRKRLLNNIYYA